jgi:hypothetical protein
MMERETAVFLILLWFSSGVINVLICVVADVYNAREFKSKYVFTIGDLFVAIPAVVLGPVLPIAVLFIILLDVFEAPLERLRKPLDGLWSWMSNVPDKSLFEKDFRLKKK